MTLTMTGDDRESFATKLIEEVRRWPGVEMRPLASPTEPGEDDGVEFRLFGRQFGHVHTDCQVHVALTKALKECLLGENLVEPLDVAPTSRWAMYSPMTRDDAARAIWLLRLNYVRMRRQRLTPLAAESSRLLKEHEAALAGMSTQVAYLLKRTQARMTPRPLPSLES